MPGDWISIDHSLPDKPEVLAIHESTGAGIGEILLRLFLLWRMADRQTVDGVLRGVGPRALAASCGGDEKFWKIVEAVGWLEFTADGAAIPRFTKRFGASARKRMTNAKWMATSRAKEGNRNESPTTGVKGCGAGASTDSPRPAPQNGHPPPSPPPSPQTTIQKPLRGNRRGGFTNVSEADLRDPSRMLALLVEEQAKRNPLATDSQADRLRVLCMAAKALDEAKTSPGGYFRTLLKNGGLQGATDVQEELARDQMRKLNAQEMDKPIDGVPVIGSLEASP